MSVLPQDYSKYLKTMASAWKASGPVTWGLVAGTATAGVLLVACFSPVILVASTAIASTLLLSEALATRHQSPKEEYSECWPEAANRIGERVECLAQEAEYEEARFQSLVASERGKSRSRLH